MISNRKRLHVVTSKFLSGQFHLVRPLWPRSWQLDEGEIRDDQLCLESRQHRSVRKWITTLTGDASVKEAWTKFHSTDFDQLWVLWLFLHDGQLKNSPRFCVHWDILLKILQIEATHVSNNQHIFRQVSMFMTGRLDHILDFCSTFIFGISPFQWKCTPHISSKKPMECHAAKYGVMSPSPAIFVCFWSWNTSSIVISEFWIMLLAYLVPCLE